MPSRAVMAELATLLSKLSAPGRSKPPKPRVHRLSRGAKLRTRLSSLAGVDPLQSQRTAGGDVRQEVTDPPQVLDALDMEARHGYSNVQGRNEVFCSFAARTFKLLQPPDELDAAVRQLAVGFTHYESLPCGERRDLVVRARETLTQWIQGGSFPRDAYKAPSETTGRRPQSRITKLGRQSAMQFDDQQRTGHQLETIRAESVFNEDEQQPRSVVADVQENVAFDDGLDAEDSNPEPYFVGSVVVRESQGDMSERFVWQRSRKVAWRYVQPQHKAEGTGLQGVDGLYERRNWEELERRVEHVRENGPESSGQTLQGFADGIEGDVFTRAMASSEGTGNAEQGRRSQAVPASDLARDSASQQLKGPILDETGDEQGSSSIRGLLEEVLIDGQQRSIVGQISGSTEQLGKDSNSGRTEQVSVETPSAQSEGGAAESVSGGAEWGVAENLASSSSSGSVPGEGADGTSGVKEKQGRFVKEETIRQRQVFAESATKAADGIPDLLQDLSDVEQRSDEWHELRKNRLTASSFHKVFDLFEGSRVSLWEEKIGVAPPFAGNRATAWGTRSEPLALKQYMSISDHTVEHCAFKTMGSDKAHDWIGGSPDGLIRVQQPECSNSPQGNIVHGLSRAIGDGVLEIKCPFNRGKPNLARPPAKAPYYYVPQVQGLMDLMDCEWCDLYVWTIKGSTVFRMKRAREYWGVAYDVLAEYWWVHVVPARLALQSGAVIGDIERLRPLAGDERLKWLTLESKRLASNAQREEFLHWEN